MQELGVKLRRFEDADAADVCDMVRRGHMSGSVPGQTRFEVDDLCMQHGQAWALNVAEHSYMFVLTLRDENVRDKERIEGCGAIGIKEQDPQTGWITVLSVMPEYRYLGLGRMIMDALEAVARELNLKKLELKASTPSFGFYEILGYVCRGEEPKYADTGLYQMEKILSEG